MPSQQDDRDSRGVSFTGNMLVQWEARRAGAPPSLSEAAEQNARLLRAILVSQELRSEPGDELGDRAGADVARVEAKLDLLLDMVSQLLRCEQQGASQSPVLLWLTGAAWRCQGGRLPAVGERLWLALYVDTRLAQPLRLPVLVTGITPGEGASEVTVTFDSLDEQVADLLGKLIFRQHRRMIAQQKAEKKGQDGLEERS